VVVGMTGMIIESIADNRNDNARLSVGQWNTDADTNTQIYPYNAFLLDPP